MLAASVPRVHSIEAMLPERDKGQSWLDIQIKRSSPNPGWVWKPHVVLALKSVHWVFVEKVTPMRWRVFCAFRYDPAVAEVVNNVKTAMAKELGLAASNAEQTHMYLDHLFGARDGHHQRIFVFACKRRAPGRIPRGVLKRRAQVDKARRKGISKHRTSADEFEEFLQSRWA
jgi:hypothetical protein